MERKHKALIQALARVTFDQAKPLLRSHIQEVAKFLVRNYPREARRFLTYYAFCLRKEYKNRYAVLEYAAPLHAELLAQIKAQVDPEKKSQWALEERPELLGGFCVQRGDTRWDVSLKGQLDALTKYLS